MMAGRESVLHIQLTLQISILDIIENFQDRFIHREKQSLKDGELIRINTGKINYILLMILQLI